MPFSHSVFVLSLIFLLLFSSISCAVVECNGCPAEEPTRGVQTSADQEVPHAEVLPEQSTSDFDFNEFFNLEKTMPGLASVSAGAPLAVDITNVTILDSHHV